MSAVGDSVGDRRNRRVLVGVFGAQGTGAKKKNGNINKLNGFKNELSRRK